MYRCGDCVEATDAKLKKENGPEFWHSIGRSSRILKCSIELT